MISADLREMLFRVVEGGLTVRELEEWLVPNAPALIRDPRSDDSELVASLELGLVEYGAGMRSVEAFRDLVRAELEKYPIVWINYSVPTTIEATSSSSSSPNPSITWLRRIDITPEPA